MYSGYLHPTPHDHVHYFLAQSGGDGDANASVPLVLWLNGGPGASSLMGAFTELGPFIMASNTTLMKNPYAWNTIADVLYLESPTGVGFSWCDAMKQGDVCKHTDTSTAELNLASLRQFLDAFPEYKGRDFHIWGESYAGVYVPTLADLVYESDLPVNFRGFGVGDPCTDEKSQTFTGQLSFNLQYAYDNGFVSAKNYRYLTHVCSTVDAHGVRRATYTDPGCRTAWRMYDVATGSGAGSGPITKLPHSGYIDPYSAFGPNNGDFWDMLSAWLASPEVMQALHVDSFPVNPWSLFADHLDYTKEYMACFYDSTMPEDAKPKFNTSMLPIYNKLVNKLSYIFVFNGDSDPSVEMRGTEEAIESLELPVKWGGDWRPWFYVPQDLSWELIKEKLPWWGPFLGHNTHLMGPQLAGFVKTYEGLSFATVHTSGHMVPQYKPQLALHMFKHVTFTPSRDLAPLLSVIAVDNATDDEFYGKDDEFGYMARWVKSAEGPFYAGDAPSPMPTEEAPEEAKIQFGTPSGKTA